MKYVLVAALSLFITACGSSPAESEVEVTDDEEFDPMTVASRQVTTHDLRHYELVGPVKSCRRTTYFDVVRGEDGELTVDTLGTNFVESTAYFDEIGGYVTKKSERLRRDEQGRIVRWEDRHPNYSSIHPGFLKDTLAYEYIDSNHIRASGLGSVTVVVTDDLGNIVGQQSVSTSPRYNTSASNIYRRYDRHGNWTERLTVWSTQVGDDSVPSMHYSIDRRKLSYYK